MEVVLPGFVFQTKIQIGNSGYTDEKFMFIHLFINSADI